MNMKPYGVPRLIEAECSDKADIKRFGFATTDRCSRKDRGKNVARRLWKKQARNKSKRALITEYKIFEET